MEAQIKCHQDEKCAMFYESQNTQKYKFCDSTAKIKYSKKGSQLYRKNAGNDHNVFVPNKRSYSYHFINKFL